MTIFYYPALLAYVASTIAYIIDPNLANSGIYTAAIIVVLYWASVLVSSRGSGTDRQARAPSGTVIGTLIPGAILVVMGVVFLAPGQPFRGADERPPSAAGVERAGGHRADRQQLPRVLRAWR